MGLGRGDPLALVAPGSRRKTGGMKVIRGALALLLLSVAGLARAGGVTLHIPETGWQVVNFDEISLIRADSVDASVAVAGYSRWARLAFVARLPSPVPAGKASTARMARGAVSEADKILSMVSRELRVQAGGLPQDLQLTVVGGGFGADDYRAIVSRRAGELFRMGPDAVQTVGGGTALYSVAVSARSGITTERSEPGPGPQSLTGR